MTWFERGIWLVLVIAGLGAAVSEHRAAEREIAVHVRMLVDADIKLEQQAVQCSERLAALQRQHEATRNLKMAPTVPDMIEAIKQGQKDNPRPWHERVLEPEQH